MNKKYAAKFRLVPTLVGCASSRESGSSEVLGSPVPEASTQPRRDRERRMEEVWKAPFAVEHRGTRPDRQQRPAVVQVASPMTVASAEPAPEPPTETPVAPPAAAPAAPPRRTTEPLLGETVPPPPARSPATRTPTTRAPTTPPARTPAQPPARTPARAQPTETARPAAGTRTHVVAQGETLFGLARRYGVSVDNLRAANKLSDNSIRIGQRLVIPAR